VTKIGNNDKGVRRSIKAMFGDEVLTEGEIDRAKLGELIFSNPQKRKQLNRLMHRKVFWGLIKELY
jgi:dephospho-CoA kinase